MIKLWNWIRWFFLIRKIKQEYIPIGIRLSMYFEIYFKRKYPELDIRIISLNQIPFKGEIRLSGMGNSGMYTLTELDISEIDKIIKKFKG